MIGDVRTVEGQSLNAKIVEAERLGKRGHSLFASDNANAEVSEKIGAFDRGARAERADHLENVLALMQRGKRDTTDIAVGKITVRSALHLLTVQRDLDHIGLFDGKVGGKIDLRRNDVVQFYEMFDFSLRR